MARLRTRSAAALVALVLVAVPPVLPSTGVCDANPPTSMAACLTALHDQALVVNDIFHALPAGAAMRYVAVVAGNDGLDVPECAYDSAVGQVDTVAGLTEAGFALCAVWNADVLFRDGFEECSL